MKKPWKVGGSLIGLIIFSFLTSLAQGFELRSAGKSMPPLGLFEANKAEKHKRSITMLERVADAHSLAPPPLREESEISMNLEWGINRPGQDIRSLTTKSPMECHKTCAGEPGCVSFTWVQPGIQGPSGMCWLKRSAPDPKNDPCCVSGLLNSELLQQVRPSEPPAEVPEARAADPARELEREMKEVLGLSEPSMSTPAPGQKNYDIPSLSANVTMLRFFESGYDLSAYEDREYKTRFPQSSSRYIYWELNLKHPPPGRRVDFTIDAVWKESEGGIFTRQQRESYLEPRWESSWFTLGFGWEEPGNWKLGRYRVDLFIEGEKVASESIEVTEEVVNKALPETISQSELTEESLRPTTETKDLRLQELAAAIDEIRLDAKAGKLRAALHDSARLQNELEAFRLARIANWLPPAPEGWNVTEDEWEAKPVLSGWRNYSGPNGANVKIAITERDGGKEVVEMTAKLVNPARRKANEQIRKLGGRQVLSTQSAEEIHGRHFWVLPAASRDHMYDGQTTVQVTVHQVPRDLIDRRFIAPLDFPALESEFAPVSDGIPEARPADEVLESARTAALVGRFGLVAECLNDAHRKLDFKRAERLLDLLPKEIPGIGHQDFGSLQGYPARVLYIFRDNFQDTRKVVILITEEADEVQAWQKEANDQKFVTSIDEKTGERSISTMLGTDPVLLRVSGVSVPDATLKNILTDQLDMNEIGKALRE